MTLTDGKWYYKVSVYCLLSDFGKDSFGKYFGTDGFRGKAGEVLTAEHALQNRPFSRLVLREPSCERHGPLVIGKDTPLLLHV